MRSNRSAAAPEVKRALEGRGPCLGVARQSRQRKQFGAERHRHAVQARIAFCAGQIIDGVADFDRIAGGAGQRLVHVGDERDRRQAGVGGDGRDAGRELAGGVQRRHEGAGAGLHVHDQPLQSGGELLRQDRGGDERDRLDRRRDVADGVEAPVGRREVRRLADDRAARLLHHPLEERKVRLRDVAGDRIELVERAAGVAEAAPGDHRHIGAAGGEHRRQHQRHVVADAAGRVLVERRAGQVRLAPIEARA